MDCATINRTEVVLKRSNDQMQVANAAKHLPLASLRLLVPPLQLITTSMWQILKKKEMLSFWKVSEFVSFVMEAVPELLVFKHWTQLTLGLRARFIFELCRRGEDQLLILSYLENLKLQQSALYKELSDEERAGGDFTKFIKDLLQDTQERQSFFQEGWHEEYLSQFDCDLQLMFWEFLCRLNQLLPAPELEQTVLWLGESAGLEEFFQCIPEPKDLKSLLHHHKQLGHLEQHVPPSTMGDHISAFLSNASQNKRLKPEVKCSVETESNPLLLSNEHSQPLFVEEAGIEIFTMTECTEIELTASATDLDSATLNRSTGKKTGVGLSENAVNDLEEGSITEERNKLTILKDEAQVTGSTEREAVFMDGSNKATGGVAVIALNGNVLEEKKAADTIFKADSQTRGADQRRTPGPHACPDCDKKFKFASFLVAHRVIHTGERPYKCAECGQCFSFRQSLDRHRHTHKTGKSIERPVCCECFPVSAEPSVHKLTHSTEALGRHMQTHSDINDRGHLDGDGKREVTEHENMEQKAGAVKEQKADGDLRTSANQVIDGNLMDDVISLVQVRTSQRKHKPTKKMKHLLKRLEMQRKAEKTRDSVMKPVQLTKSSDHSYGTTMTSPQLPHKGYSEKEQIQQRIDQPEVKEKTTAEDKEPGNATHNFECTVCGEQYESFKGRKDHIESVHMRNGVFFCNRCDKDYTWRGAFVRHMRMYCPKGRADSVVCPRCDQAFSCSSALNSHIQAQHQERAHTCNCGKSFVYKAALTAHQRTHLKERPHVCQQCGKGFLYKGGLLGHMKIHSQERPFVCSHCGKSFKRERNMKKHERCHTREDVFKCSQCDKTFVYKATLTRHELTHTGERPFLCSECGKGFFSHAELLKHERFHSGHTPFECPHCGKKFTQSCYLTVHLRYHTGAKPYECADCDKSFLSANRLKRHQRTHTGERPYVCGECGKGFRQSYHLKMHQRTHAMELM